MLIIGDVMLANFFVVLVGVQNVEHVEQQSEEQLFYGPSGEEVTLQGYAACYNMSMEELLALYPDMAGPTGLSPDSLVAQEAEVEDISEYLALCLS